MRGYYSPVDGRLWEEAGGRAHTHVAWHPICRRQNGCNLPFGPEVKGASHYDIDKFIDLEERAQWCSAASLCLRRLVQDLWKRLELAR